MCDGTSDDDDDCSMDGEDIESELLEHATQGHRGSGSNRVKAFFFDVQHTKFVTLAQKISENARR